MSSCNVAFKEWAVVCEALARGRQTIILRKGGIHEGRAGFRIAYDRFWLLPTKFHASADALLPEASALLPAAEPLNADGAFWVRHFAVVQHVIELTREEDALALTGQHIWSEATVRQRFQYKQPGLFCLILRVFDAPGTTRIDDTPQIAGCRSWVELPEAIPTSDLRPVLTDAAYQELFSKVAAKQS